MFSLDPKADIHLTSFKGTVSVSPKLLRKKFGEPEKSGDIESIGEYFFSDNAGNCYLIYYRLNDAPALIRYIYQFFFWRSSSPQDFHIGSKVDDVSAFHDWVLDSVQGAT